MYQQYNQWTSDVNNGVQKTISLYLRWDTGPELAKEDPASEPERDLVFARLPSEQEAARKLLSEETAPVRIFGLQTVSVLKYLIPADGTDGIHLGFLVRNVSNHPYLFYFYSATILKAQEVFYTL